MLLYVCLIRVSLNKAFEEYIQKLIVTLKCEPLPWSDMGSPLRYTYIMVYISILYQVYIKVYIHCIGRKLFQETDLQQR